MTDQDNTATQPHASASNSFKPTRAVRAFSILVTICYWLSYVAGGLLLIIFLAYSAGFVPSHMQIKLPVAFGWEQVVSSADSASPDKTYTCEFEGKVSTPAEYASHFINMLRMFFGLILVTAMIYGLYQLRLIMKTLRAGEPFDEANPKRIRTIGWIILFWEPVVFLSDVVTAPYYWSPLKASLQQAFGDAIHFQHDYNMKMGLVLVGLIVLVLSKVFAEGVRLRIEQDYTV